MKEEDALKKILEKHPKADFSIPGSEDLRNKYLPNTEYIEDKDQELRKKELENDFTELKNVATHSEINLKKSICGWVKWVVSIYLVFIASILVVLVLGEGELNDSVIIALLSTTTINHHHQHTWITFNDYQIAFSSTEN